VKYPKNFLPQRRREKTLSACFAEGEQVTNLCASAPLRFILFYLNLSIPHRHPGSLRNTALSLGIKKGEARSPFVLINFVAIRLSIKLRLITQLY
jgi:hypothetical protein